MRQAPLVLLMVGFVASGCGGDDETGRSRYPDVVVKNYMRSCTRGDEEKQAYCGCTLDKLSNDVSVGDFASVGAAGGKLPPRLERLITQAAEACADELP